jgi:hypothetical protein
MSIPKYLDERGGEDSPPESGSSLGLTHIDPTTFEKKSLKKTVL